MSKTHSVSFSINVCISDVPYLEKILRHMINQINYPFVEKRVALDPGIVEGKYAGRIQGQLNELWDILNCLKSDGIIDEIDEVPWSQDSQQEILSHYFSSDDVDLKDFSGAPIYQYLFALAQCKGDYIVHVDSDMLFYTNQGTFDWIGRGINFMENNKDVVFTTPRGGPPIAEKWYEKILHKSFQNMDDTWHPGDFISTRYFLMDRIRFENNLLPLSQKVQGEPLENSITYTAKQKGLKRMCMNTFEGYAIHPLHHDENFLLHLDELIWAIENNVYPLKRGGYRWDLRTDGQHINDWLKAIKKANNNS